MALGLSLAMWVGIIGSGKWMVSQFQAGIDLETTASTN